MARPSTGCHHGPVSGKPPGVAWRDARIRTFHGRHGRTTDRMRRVLDDAGPQHGLAARLDVHRPLVLEVGCGHGDAALAYATTHPATDLLAVDVHAPGIVRLLEECERGELSNLHVERGDAVALLDDRLGTGSLEGLHLFFPDPWPKARHHKRRFVRPDVLDLVADRLTAGASFLVATDHADYADWARAQLDAHAEFEGGPAERPRWRPVTRYEQAGIDAGRTIVDLAYVRR